jgi:hypothetical protein
VVEEISIRDYQRQASAAANVADLETRRLMREGWSRECIESEKRFGRRVARLYPLVGVSGAVKTPGGQGTLVQAFSSGCLVALVRGRATGRRANGQRYRPLVEFAVEEVEPYGKERR